MDDTAHIRPGCIDGRVQKEARGVHREAAAALLHHLSQDVHLDLDQGRRETCGHWTLTPLPRGGPAHGYTLVFIHSSHPAMAVLGVGGESDLDSPSAQAKGGRRGSIQHEKCYSRVSQTLVCIRTTWRPCQMQMLIQ